MTPPIIRRETVAENLAISPNILIRYEELGLIQVTQDRGEVGYPPTEVRRIWSILTLQRDLGVNLAGIEVILRLRDQRDALFLRLSELLDAEEHPTVGAEADPHA